MRRPVTCRGVAGGRSCGSVRLLMGVVGFLIASLHPGGSVAASAPGPRGTVVAAPVSRPPTANQEVGSPTTNREIGSPANSQEIGSPANSQEIGSPANGQEIGSPALDPEALFRKGNGLYQQNDFAGARDAYREVLLSGYEGADLYFNLGNAYFKTGDLGRAILSYERALRLDPGDADTRANLDLARSLTADAIEPMPGFWVLSALDWWMNLLPRTALTVLVALTWLAMTGGICVRILGRRSPSKPLGSWLVAGGGVGLLLFGVTLLAREGVLGENEWGIILAREVAVQSAPSAEDDLTLFHIHEGTKVRLDQRTEDWSEVVLEDGRVGWVPSGTLEEI